MTYEITSIHIQVHYPIGAGCIILLYYKLHAHSFVLTPCRYHPEPVGHFQKLENLTIAFKFMTNMENMQLVNIGKATAYFLIMHVLISIIRGGWSN